MVGQQVTVGATPSAAAEARLALLVARAGAAYPAMLLGNGARECDLVAKGNVSGLERGWLYDPATRLFRSDHANEASRSLAQLTALAATPRGELTFTCVPFGSGVRIALDRDLDQVLNGNESR